MQVKVEQEVDLSAYLTAVVSGKVRCFGAGATSEWNPLTATLADRPAMFAAGVDVKEVVDIILRELGKLNVLKPQTK